MGIKTDDDLFVQERLFGGLPYELMLVQQPEKAPVSSFLLRGVDEKVIEPWPVVSVSCSSLSAFDLARSSSLAIRCSLVTTEGGNIRTDVDGQQLLGGTFVENIYLSENDSPTPWAFSLFSRLIIRTLGTFRLRFELFCVNEEDGVLSLQAEVISNSFSSVSLRDWIAPLPTALTLELVRDNSIKKQFNKTGMRDSSKRSKSSPVSEPPPKQTPSHQLPAVSPSSEPRNTSAPTRALSPFPPPINTLPTSTYVEETPRFSLHTQVTRRPNHVGPWLSQTFPSLPLSPPLSASPPQFCLPQLSLPGLDSQHQPLLTSTFLSLERGSVMPDLLLPPLGKTSPSISKAPTASRSKDRWNTGIQVGEDVGGESISRKGSLASLLGERRESVIWEPEEVRSVLSTWKRKEES